MNLYCLCKKKH